MESIHVYFIVFAILYLVFIVFRFKTSNLFSTSLCEVLLKNGKSLTFKQMLQDNFIVYKLLKANGRKQFEKRVCTFINNKDFRAGSNIGEITDEMRIMVAASAIQITYGYPNIYFNHFQTIILYAEEYYSHITGNYHAGEVNAGGAIVLSWKNFLSGFSDLHDGRNLALHEMAHALRLTNILDNEEFDFIDRETMRRFDELAKAEMQKIENDEGSFFRQYGATNLQEFFSVAVECFFEKAEEFRTYNTNLYFLLTKILKIDLLNFYENETWFR
jgi:MtfA peptidase